MEIIDGTGSLDFHEILDLLKTEWPTEWGIVSDERLIEEFEESADREYDINKFLVSDGKKIGWYRYSTWPREKDNKDSAHTLDIVVSPGYQGLGYGEMLMRDLIDDCRKRGFQKLMSRTIEGNIKSYGLHEKTGFREAFRKGTDIVWEIAL
jgi:L-amino acid N-acyltransferase YncA